jgi:hypothetical protein
MRARIRGGAARPNGVFRNRLGSSCDFGALIPATSTKSICSGPAGRAVAQARGLAGPAGEQAGRRTKLAEERPWRRTWRASGPSGRAGPAGERAQRESRPGGLAGLAGERARRASGPDGGPSWRRSRPGGGPSWRASGPGGRAGPAGGRGQPEGQLPQWAPQRLTKRLTKRAPKRTPKWVGDQPHASARRHAPIGDGRSSRRMRNRP